MLASLFLGVSAVLKNGMFGENQMLAPRRRRTLHHDRRRTVKVPRSVIIPRSDEWTIDGGEALTPQLIERMALTPQYSQVGIYDDGGELDDGWDLAASDGGEAIHAKKLPFQRLNDGWDLAAIDGGEALTPQYSQVGIYDDGGELDDGLDLAAIDGAQAAGKHKWYRCNNGQYVYARTYWEARTKCKALLQKPVCCHQMSLTCAKCKNPFKTERQICQANSSLTGCEAYRGCCLALSLSCYKCKNPHKTDKQICEESNFQLSGCEQYQTCCNSMTLTCQRCKNPGKSDRKICHEHSCAAGHCGRYTLQGCGFIGPCHECEQTVCCDAMTLTCQRCKNPGKSDRKICHEHSCAAGHCGRYTLQGCGFVGPCGNECDPPVFIGGR